MVFGSIHRQLSFNNYIKNTELTPSLDTLSIIRVFLRHTSIAVSFLLGQVNRGSTLT